MEETKLNFLLMGKTGHGKSATGNTILNRRVFKTSSNVTSETKEVNFNFALFDKYTLLMVDGPGLEDTDIEQVQDKTAAVKNIDKALAMCYGGVDAFLLVYKFGNRFTKEDKGAIDALKTIFGDEFVERVIVVVTFGDNFWSEMEDQGSRNETFPEWCIKQRDPVFMKLYKDCDERFVLFNNRETNEEKKRAQVLEVVQLAERLQKHKGRYTRQCFETAKYEREKLILKMRAPQLKEEFQRKISFLQDAIEDLSARPSDAKKEKIRARIYDLRNEIDQQDQSYDVLQELEETLTQVEENLNDVDVRKLKDISNQTNKLEETRESKKTWDLLGTVCKIAGDVISVNPVGAALVSGIRNVLFDSNEDGSEQQKQIKDKKK